MRNLYRALLVLLLLPAPASLSGQEQPSDVPSVNWLHVEVGFGSALAMSFVLEEATDNSAVSIIAPIAAAAVAGGIKETGDCDGQCAKQGDFAAFVVGAVPGAVLGHFLSKWILD